jgi:hypothetical protein
MVKALEELMLTVFNDAEWQAWVGSRAGVDGKGGIMNSEQITQRVKNNYNVLKTIVARMGF